MIRAAGSLLADNWIGKYVNNRMIVNTQEERDAVKNLIHQMVMRSCSSEVAITMILKFGAYAREPLVNFLPKLKMKVAFLYGDQDWMDREMPDQMIN